MQDSKKGLFAQRRYRYQKLAKLRTKYKMAPTDGDRVKVLAKVAKVAPWLKQEEFLAPLTKAAAAV
jgi:hypothetical protein